MSYEFLTSEVENFCNSEQNLVLFFKKFAEREWFEEQINLNCSSYIKREHYESLKSQFIYIKKKFRQFEREFCNTIDYSRQEPIPIPPNFKPFFPRDLMSFTGFLASRRWFQKFRTEFKESNVCECLTCELHKRQIKANNINNLKLGLNPDDLIKYR